MLSLSRFAIRASRCLSRPSSIGLSPAPDACGPLFAFSQVSSRLMVTPDHHRGVAPDKGTRRKLLLNPRDGLCKPLHAGPCGGETDEARSNKTGLGITDADLIERYRLVNGDDLHYFFAGRLEELKVEFHALIGYLDDSIGPDQISALELVGIKDGNIPRVVLV